jgi:phosphatidylinositol alpha-1,6-mannosyltransferase
MKTLLITLEYPPFRGGVANYYYNLAKFWPLEDKISILDNNNNSLFAPGPLSWLKAWPAIKRYWDKGKFDYLLAGQILPIGTLCWLLSLVRPLRYGVFFHGMDLLFALRSPRKAWLARRIINRADKLICANSYVASLIENNFPNTDAKTVVVNPGIDPGAPYIKETDLQSLDNKYNLSGKMLLFSLCRLVKRKGVDNVFRALDSLKEVERQNIFYAIAGIGQDSRYLHDQLPESLREQVLFLGELSEAEKWLWLSRCDAFILPSRQIGDDFEGFGIVYLEANLYGKPVIAGRSGGVSDAVEDGVNGLLVDPENVEDIAAAIKRLNENPEFRRSLGEKGKNRAINEFNWEKQAARLASAIK